MDGAHLNVKYTWKGMVVWLNRKFNSVMFVFALAGGIMGFFAGELVMSELLYKIPEVFVIGIYFGVFAFFVGIMCLFAEMISPRLNGMNWRRMYLGYSWKLLVPCTLAALFVLGTLLQFIYGLNFSGGKKITDIVMLVDTSASMSQTDPKNKRFDAVKTLMDNMTQDNRISVFVFNDNAAEVQSMSGITDGIKGEISRKLRDYSVPDGKTNIKGALEEAAKHIKDTEVPGKSSMVILLSDGGDNYGLTNAFRETLEPYINEYIPIFTVGMPGSDTMLLNSLSNNTGGRYYSVDDAGNLGSIFTEIYMNRDMRLLNDARYGLASSNVLYGILRVLFLIILGAALGLAVGLVFDNKYIAKGLTLGGAVSGLAAGLILETGFSILPGSGFYIRLAADAVLACIFTIFTLLVNQGDNARLNKRGAGGGQNLGNANSFGIDSTRDGRSSFV